MNKSLPLRAVILLLVFAAIADIAQCADWPPIPAKNAEVTLPAQEWPLRPGPRTIAVWVYYPGGKLESLAPDSGIMLSLHNWGGTHAAGTAAPQILADRFRVVTLCVNYLQSGQESITGPEPYDYGYLQALDALRALSWMYRGLQERGVKFDTGRIFTTGGSGGGNVSLMANKLAPRTFAAVIDMCGMKKLTNDIAFGEAGGSGLNARYKADASDPFHLSAGAQELRFVGAPAHLKTMRELGNSAIVYVVHGREDTTCPFEHAEELVANMQSSGVQVTPKFVGAEQLDGQVFKSTGHSLGDRTQIVIKVAGAVLDPDSPTAVRRKTPSDFDLRDDKVQYVVSGGRYVISYETGYPVGRFDPRP